MNLSDINFLLAQLKQDNNNPELIAFYERKRLELIGTIKEKVKTKCAELCNATNTNLNQLLTIVK